MRRSIEYLDSKGAAQELNCTVQHLRLLLRQERLAGERLGRDWFVSLEEVSRYRAVNERADKGHALTVLQRSRSQLALFDDVEGPVNVSTVPQRSPFRYPGGKTWLIPLVRRWMASFAKPARYLFEPFAGGGSIGLMAAFEKYVEKTWLFEIDPDIAAVWRVMLSSKSKQLQKKILSFNCTLGEVKALVEHPPETDVEAAFVTLVKNRVSRGGILAPGAGLVKNGEAGRGIASRWYPETLCKRIAEIYSHRAVVGFTEGDGFASITNGSPDESTAFFVDPPYPKAGKRLYKYHTIDHFKLLNTLASAKGPILITYDENAEIQSHAEGLGFETRLVPMKSTHHQQKLELLISKDFKWLNSLSKTEVGIQC